MLVNSILNILKQLNACKFRIKHPKQLNACNCYKLLFYICLVDKIKLK